MLEKVIVSIVVALASCLSLFRYSNNTSTTRGLKQSDNTSKNAKIFFHSMLYVIIDLSASLSLSTFSSPV